MTIFDIKRYSINDGPGIRTTVFFKGCPLRCVWCHNPESWSEKPQKTYKQSKCIGCRTCVEACPQGVLELTADGISPIPGKICLQCGRCAEECPTTALEMCGREWSMDELLAEIEKERDIMMDSGGGVTLCGGEPLMHPDDTVRILQELGKRGFHRAVDTSLYADAGIVRRVAYECELMLVDLKHTDSAQHKRFTGVGNELIMENIRLLCELGTPFWIRIPLIEGVNTAEENIETTARFLSEIKQTIKQSPSCERMEESFQVNLLPYHDVGKDKHRRLWSKYNPQNFPLAAPSEEVQKRCLAQFASYGIKTIVGG